jgi:hypothetical protein
MKFVLGFFWAFAAEQRAIVGELCSISMMSKDRQRMLV